MISVVRIILHASIFLVFTYELVKVKEDFFPPVSETHSRQSYTVVVMKHFKSATGIVEDRAEASQPQYLTL
jgi:hypothetical protein